MTKVMAFGSFDLFHKGHEEYLKQAKALGKELIVVVSRDRNYEKIKKKKPLFAERQRLKEVKSKKYVDKAVLGDEYDFYKVIEKEKPNTLCLGYDQKASISTIKRVLAERGITKIRIVRAKSHMPHTYKSSKLKSRIIGPDL